MSMLSPKTLLLLFTLYVLSACGNTPVGTEASENCVGTNIEVIDTCLVGQTIRDAIEQLHIDTNQFYAFDEPPGILRGLRIEIGTTYKIELLVDRISVIGKPVKSFRQRYQYLEKETIKAVIWTNLKTGAHREIYSSSN